MRVVAILQARMGSTRLPGKVMLPLAGKPMVQNIIERVQRAKRLDDVVLAYPYEDNARLFTIVQDTGCGYVDYIGDPNDLVGRYLKAATMYLADIIVRIPCDNPCVEPEYIDEAVEAYMSQPLMFYSNTTVLYPKGPECIDGLGAEVFSLSRLKWLDEVTQGMPDLREHPHRLFYNHAELCGGGVLIKNLNAEVTLRLDVNASNDYEFINDIYQHFGHNRFHVSEVLTYLSTTTKEKMP